MATKEQLSDLKEYLKKGCPENESPSLVKTRFTRTICQDPLTENIDVSFKESIIDLKKAEKSLKANKPENLNVKYYDLNGMPLKIELVVRVEEYPGRLNWSEICDNDFSIVLDEIGKKVITEVLPNCLVEETMG